MRIALKASSVALEAAYSHRLCRSGQRIFDPDLWFLLPYKNALNSSLTKAFEVFAFIEFDTSARKITLKERKVTRPLLLDYSLEDLLKITKLPKQVASRTVQWQATETDQSYLKKVKACLNDIKAGRYYQINLLRYFDTKEPLCLHSCYENHAGPCAAWWKLPDCELVSFSPEDFVSARQTSQGLILRAEPIKGTISVSQCETQDRKNRKILADSVKDQAELHMIVDLMRNDLNRVCEQGSVRVLDKGSLHSFSNVHHLIAKVEGRLSKELELAVLIEALCPAGSITGAPKIEVMQAIEEYEDRPRDYFMGHVVLLDRGSSQFSSSILIRTVYTKGYDIHFAAGSGLVIGSQPELEMEEIFHKGRVVGLK